MRSELFRIPIELTGVPLFGVGLLIAVWCALGAICVWRWSRGPDLGAKLREYVPVFVVVAVVLVGLPYVMPAGLPIRGYGVMLVLAGSTGLAMAIHRGQQHGLHADAILSMTMLMFILGIIGARLFYVIEYWEESYGREGFVAGLKKAVQFTEGGLVVYGSLIGAAVAFTWYTRRHGLPVLAMADLLAPSLAVGLALGRVGCLLNGCCYGGVCDLPWAITFPQYNAPEIKNQPTDPLDELPTRKYSPPYGDQVSHGQMHGFRLEEAGREEETSVIVGSVSLADPPTGLKPGAEVTAINGARIKSLGDAQYLLLLAYDREQPVSLQLASQNTIRLPAVAIAPRSLPVHPTQIYSAVNAALLGWFLWLYYPFRRRDGEVAAVMLTLYPIARFFLERIRTDESAIFGTGLSISQNVSLAILVAMLAGWAYLLRQPAARTDRFAPA